MTYEPARVKNLRLLSARLAECSRPTTGSLASEVFCAPDLSALCSGRAEGPE